MTAMVTELVAAIRGARPHGQTHPGCDEQDAQGKKRRLALERRVAAPDVAETAQAAQDEERADK